jgi:hypothetical protein
MAAANAAAAASGVGGMSMPLIIGAIIVVIIVVAGGYLLLAHGSSKGTTNGSAGSGGSGNPSGTGSGSNSSSGTGSLPGGYSNATCGPGNYCLSKSEMASLLGGTGGNYSAVYGDKYSFLTQIFASQSSGNTTAIFNNVTGAYIIGYNQSNVTSSTKTGTATIEAVLKSNNAKWVYEQMMRNSSTSWNATNATMNGLTYSYTGAASSAFAATYFVGYKDGAAVWVLSIGSQLPQQQLATDVSGDIP